MEDKYIKIFTNPFKMIEADINKCLFTKIFSHVGLVDVTHFQVVLLLLWQLITIILINYNYISSFYFTSNQPTKISWQLWHCLVYVYQKWFLKKNCWKHSLFLSWHILGTHKYKISKCFFFPKHIFLIKC